MRMDEIRVARKILHDKPGGKRKRGRPRLRWLDDVEADLRSMGIKRWRTKVLNREEWASIIKEAKAKLKRAVVLQEEDVLYLVNKAGEKPMHVVFHH
jgi:hypothetical protein